MKKNKLGIGDWGLGIGPNPQSPIPNPQSPIQLIKKINKLKINNNIQNNNNNFILFFNILLNFYLNMLIKL